ncbi:HAD family hydrolase [Patescibacteria group bacterium]|nr:HAD family hydrolase [Patescibacteria group bacterium]
MIRKIKTKNKIKAVLFDYNGVIVDDLGACGRAECDVIVDLGGKRLSMAYWFKNIHQDWQGFYLEHGVPKNKLSKVHNLMNSRYKKYEKYIKANSGVKSLLQKLNKNNIKMGILSAAGQDIVKNGLQKFDLEDYFSFIVAGEDVVKPKPHPQGLLKAIKLFKLQPTEIIYVDDMPKMFPVASKIGFKTVGLYSQVSGDLSAADIQIKKIKSLANYLN